MNELSEVIRNTYVDLGNSFIQVMLQFGVPVDFTPCNAGEIAILNVVSDWGILLVGIFFKSLDKIVGATIKL